MDTQSRVRRRELLILLAALGVGFGAGRLSAQPALTGDGILTDWRVVVQRATACFNPTIDSKARTITCG